MNQLERTVLFDLHKAAGARLVPFAGWEMPVSYSGILEEHKSVRSRAGVFDVSHMGRFRLSGPRAGEVLDYLTTGRVSVLPEGRFLYTLLLNERGGVLEDLLVGRQGDSFLIVVNAANHQADFSHIDGWSERLGGPRLVDKSEEVALVALQGPESRGLLGKLLGGPASLESLGYYRMASFPLFGEETVVSRTGYTGELGYEIFVSRRNAPGLWESLLELGALPCGLGARDTLRLEMGYALYGHELDENHTPLEAGLAWAVDLEKEDFIGKKALLKQREGGLKVLLKGIAAGGRDIPREGYVLLDKGREAARLASGGFGPTVGTGIGTAYLPVELAATGTPLELRIRDRSTPVEVVRPPFYRQGTAKI